jgi:octaheme c-type cytochrome (tetrathionate reductase family)
MSEEMQPTAPQEPQSKPAADAPARNVRRFWLIGLVAIVAAIAVPLYFLWPRSAQATVDPWANVPVRAVHTSHADIITGLFEKPQQVTQACLECHEDAAGEVMHTSHWTWQGEEITVPWRDEAVTIGKKNQINNFCIGTQGNERTCMSCHAGYGWSDADFDFTESSNVDCLVCHADVSTYGKGDYGLPAEDVDLLAAAQSVRAPTRDNCGKCHFDGGGGNNVKHGDLDESLYFPSGELDVHMGANDFICTDCHQTEAHEIKGKLLADNYQIDPAKQVACTDCHAPNLHEDDRINDHVATVACQTCHVPSMALKNPTKTDWDWSTAGQDLPEDHYSYLKIKGNFVYDKNVTPTYTWFDGNLDYRYLLGDTIDPTQITEINPPAGDIADPNAKIFPFKVHRANQPYDTEYNYLLQPVTSGEGGFWTTFDWNESFELAQEKTGLDYSGSYGFARTDMYWPVTHMVQPKANALQCDDCHTAGGRMDWEALGYPGDPIEWGGRFDDQPTAAR